MPPDSVHCVVDGDVIDGSGSFCRDAHDRAGIRDCGSWALVLVVEELGEVLDLLVVVEVVHEMEGSGIRLD